MRSSIFDFGRQNGNCCSAVGIQRSTLTDAVGIEQDRDLNRIQHSLLFQLGKQCVGSSGIVCNCPLWMHIVTNVSVLRLEAC